MDFETFFITLFLGVLGTVILGNLLNIPDAGAIVSIAFVGGCIVKEINTGHKGEQKDLKPKNFEEASNELSLLELSIIIQIILQ